MLADELCGDLSGVRVRGPRFPPPTRYTHGRMRAPAHDLYEVLGVSPAATTAELRHAYRKLALQHHPDRAGPHSAPRFAQIAEAYRMLSDPTARTAYDAFRFERTAARVQTPDDLRDDGLAWNVGRNNWSASWRRGIVDLLSRLSGPLDR